MIHRDMMHLFYRCGCLILFFAINPMCPANASIHYNDIKTKYSGETPTEWGENVHGVKTRLATQNRVIAITLDACGSHGDGNGRWIDKYPKIFQQLSADPLFEIENHGLEHKPASINGRSVYGIPGKKPLLYRSGTAYYDDVAIRIIGNLGYNAMGFTLLSNGGFFVG